MLSGCLRKAIFNNWETTRERVEGEGKMVREEGRKKERWAIIASFPNLGDKSRWFSLSLCLWVSVYANYQNTPTPWQQHQAASVRLFWKGGEKRGEASPFPSRADMWYSCWAVTRTHHTHRLCSHPPMRRLKITPSSLPFVLPPISPSLSTTYMSISLPAATCQHSHQSLCLSASLAESMGCPWSRCWYCCSVQG